MSWPVTADDLAVPHGAATAMLASDADRDAAAGQLNDAFAEGRLTAAERGERVQAAFAARTWADLTRLTADLPAKADHAASAPSVRSAGVDWCLMCALLVLCPPVGIAWLLTARRGSCR